MLKVQKRGGDMKKFSLVNSVIIILLLVIIVLLVVIMVKLDHPVAVNKNVTADTAITDELDYKIINGEITITGYSGKNMDLVIPKTIDGYPVTQIGKSAFSKHEYLNSVIIPDGVVAIGDSAFYNCDELTSIELPESLVTIGNDAFRYCSGLTDITIPNGVVTIGDHAFSACFGLTSIIIPDSVTSIGNNAFSDCFELKSITIPDSVSFIDYKLLAGTDVETIYVKENSYAHRWCVNNFLERKVHFY